MSIAARLHRHRRDDTVAGAFQQVPVQAAHRSGITHTGMPCSAQVPICARRRSASGRRSVRYEPVNEEVSALRPARGIAKTSAASGVPTSGSE